MRISRMERGRTCGFFGLNEIIAPDLSINIAELLLHHTHFFVPFLSIMTIKFAWLVGSGGGCCSCGSWFFLDADVPCMNECWWWSCWWWWRWCSQICIPHVHVSRELSQFHKIWMNDCCARFPLVSRKKGTERHRMKRKVEGKKSLG